MSEWPDFKAQKTMLQEFCDAEGILLDMSPKCHPEIAGLGIEYCWAVSKYFFREHNDFQVKTLNKRIETALERLNLATIWKCARRARDYMRAYRALEDGRNTELEYQQIEQQKKLAKHHRDALDFSLEWVQSLLKASEGSGSGGA